MSRPLGALAAWLTHLFGGGRTGREVAAAQWVRLDVSGPSPLLEMYRDLLAQHGIPAVVTDAGVGPGALGGVPGFGSLRVPAADAVRARELVHEADDDDEGFERERTLRRGE
ncbi:MAG TPA: DUF2007 domain-containing protein [Ktedonobacterales bacterium]